MKNNTKAGEKDIISTNSKRLLVSKVLEELKPKQIDEIMVLADPPFVAVMFATEEWKDGEDTVGMAVNELPPTSSYLIVPFNNEKYQFDGAGWVSERDGVTSLEIVPVLSDEVDSDETEPETNDSAPRTAEEDKGVEPAGTLHN